MQKSRSMVALAALAAALAAAPAAAQEAPGAPPLSEQSGLRGLLLGFNLNGGVEGTGLPSGSRTAAGVGVTLGYGVSDALTLFTRGNYAYGSTSVDVGARYSFGGASGTLRPYVEGAFTGMGALRDGARFSGTALTGGAGVEYFLSPGLAVDAGISYSRGEWERAIEHGAGTALGVSRLNLGVRWRP